MQARASQWQIEGGEGSMTIAPESIPVVIRADHVAGPPQGHWTYTDYAALPEDGHRYELIDGVLYMAPSPGEAHQNANSKFIKKRPGNFTGPILYPY